MSSVSSGAKILYAEFTAKPGTAEEVARLLADLAVKVRAEPGNVAFDCYRLSADPAKFFVFEFYRDDAAFQTHILADYGAEFNSRLGPLIVEPHSLLTFLNPL
ncbi:MAG: antibiotic biosynthesis monooxygenase [Rhizobium sp.]|nr:antibiotic biosynthesis monooxygenase [Rhizobium sp.]